MTGDDVSQKEGVTEYGTGKGTMYQQDQGDPEA